MIPLATVGSQSRAGGGELPHLPGQLVVPGFGTGILGFKPELSRAHQAIAEVGETCIWIQWIRGQSGQQGPGAGGRFAHPQQIPGQQRKQGLAEAIVLAAVAEEATTATGITSPGLQASTVSCRCWWATARAISRLQSLLSL